MNPYRVRIAQATIIALLFGICGCTRHCPLTDKEVAIRLQHPDLRLGSELSIWKSKLGQPQIVSQLDRGNTFFFWPNQGIAVFCHPLYHGQFQHINMDQWVVTSILIPLTEEIPPLLPPCDKSSRIYFSKLLYPDLSIDQSKGLTKHCILHSVDDKVMALELQKHDSLLGDYD